MVFGSKLDLKRHSASVHDGKKPFECDICSASFAQKCNLKTHLNFVHNEENPLKCEIWSVGFGFKKGLKIHPQFMMESLLNGKGLWMRITCYPDKSFPDTCIQTLSLHKYM